MRRLTFLLFVATLASLVLVAPVMAAAPTNDAYADRTAIGSLPFLDSRDTTEATTDATDAEAAAGCGAPATDASVWYELVPAADGLIMVSSDGSDYAVGIIAATGSPGSFELQACGPGGVNISGTAGVPIAILVFDYDGVGNGGNLELSVTLAPPPPTLELTVASSGSVNPRTGIATVKGTIRCTGGEEFGKNFISIQLSQTVGRFRFSGDGFGDFACDGAMHPWAFDVTSSSGKFAGGKATVSVYALACAFECAEAQIDRTITLKR
jgi:hypothetical protein